MAGLGDVADGVLVSMMTVLVGNVALEILLLGDMSGWPFWNGEAGR